METLSVSDTPVQQSVTEKPTAPKSCTPPTPGPLTVAKTIVPGQQRPWMLTVWISAASVILMLATIGLIAILHLFKFFKRIKWPDPFHDSRRHPLNDPSAPRG